MKRLLLTGALVALGLAGATYAPPLTLAQQARKAEVIVRATVGAAASVQEGGQSWTVYPLTVAETLAGDAQSLPQYQNKPSLWVLSGLQDGPLVSGGEMMLLLYKAKYDSPMVGFNQGLYPVSGAASSKVVSNLPQGTPGAAVAPAPATTTPNSVSSPPAAVDTAAPPATKTASPPPAADASPAVDPVPAAPVPPASPVADSTTTTPALPTTPPAALPAPSPAAAPATTPPAATSSPPAATLQPGQMTLEAFRQAILKARAGAGK